MTKRELLGFAFVSLICLLVSAWIFPRWADPNQNSRLNMVVAVVDDGTFQIDRYVENTVDYAKVGEHYYSDKAPGAAFLGIPLYAGFSVVLDTPPVEALTERLAESSAFENTLRPDGSGISDEKVRFALTQTFLSLIVSALPSALLCGMLYLCIARMTKSNPAGIVAALAYGMASPALPYANAFYGHQLSAALLFGAFFLVFTAAGRLGAIRLLLIGLLLGYAVVTEYPAALIVAAVFLYTCFVLAQRRQIASILWTVASGGVVALLWFGYNTVVFGAPLELGYSYSELWVDQHNTGFMSLSTPTVDAIWGITFSPFRGLFLLAPWLLLGIPGYWIWWKRSNTGQEKATLILSAVSVLAMFAFNSASHMWWGGFAIGPRYLLPGLPFLVLACGFAIHAMGRNLWPRILLAILLLWSALAVWIQMLADQAFPSDAYRNPWLAHVLPAWQQGNLARNVGTILGFDGVASLLPLFVLVAGLSVLWRLLDRRARATLEIVKPSAITPGFSEQDELNA